MRFSMIGVARFGRISFTARGDSRAFIVAIYRLPSVRHLSERRPNLYKSALHCRLICVDEIYNSEKT